MAESAQLQGAVCASPMSDVYSLGVLTAEVHGRFRTAMERAVVLGAVKREAAAEASADGEASAEGGGTRHTAARLACEAADSIVRAMLAVRPSERPSAAVVERAAMAFT